MAGFERALSPSSCAVCLQAMSILDRLTRRPRPAAPSGDGHAGSLPLALDAEAPPKGWTRDERRRRRLRGRYDAARQLRPGKRNWQLVALGRRAPRLVVGLVTLVSRGRPLRRGGGRARTGRGDRAGRGRPDRARPRGHGRALVVRLEHPHGVPRPRRPARRRLPGLRPRRRRRPGLPRGVLLRPRQRPAPAGEGVPTGRRGHERAPGPRRRRGRADDVPGPVERARGVPARGRAGAGVGGVPLVTVRPRRRRRPSSGTRRRHRPPREPARADGDAGRDGRARA